MAKASPAWIALADARRVKLLSAHLAFGRRTHLDTRDELHADWQGHEHGRPTPLAAKNGKTYAAPNHDEEEALRRFAKQVADWLVSRQRRFRFHTLTLFAPPRFASEVRRQMPDQFQQSITHHETDLINLPSAELHRHPAIRETVGL